MNLVTMRRALLEQIGELEQSGGSSGRALRIYYSLTGDRSGSASNSSQNALRHESLRHDGLGHDGLRYLITEYPTSSAPKDSGWEDRGEAGSDEWAWLFCLDLGAPPQGAERGLPPAFWEVLEFTGTREDAGRTLQALIQLFIEGWEIAPQHLRLMIDAGIHWNGSTPQIPPEIASSQLELDAGANESGSEALSIQVLADGESNSLRIRFAPHRLFSLALGLPEVSELPPFDRMIVQAEELGVSIVPERRVLWLESFRAWAHIMNHVELFDSEMDAELEAVREEIRRLSGENGEPSSRLPDDAILDLSDMARGLEDELCEVLLEFSRGDFSARCEAEADVGSGKAGIEEAESAAAEETCAGSSSEEDETAGNETAEDSNPMREAPGELVEEHQPTLEDLGLLEQPRGEVIDQPPTEFVGDLQDACESRVLRLLNAEGEFQDYLEEGTGGWLITERTCCFGYGGGLACDLGEVQWHDGHARILDVSVIAETAVHAVWVRRGTLRANTSVDLLIQTERRRELERNFTAVAAMLGQLFRERGSVPDVDEVRVTPEHFEVSLWAESAKLEEMGEKQLDALRKGLEDELVSWILRSEWIDPVDDVPRGKQALQIRSSKGSSAKQEGRRCLYLGSMGWLRSDGVVVPNSSHLVLVRLEKLELDDAGVLRIEGCAGRTAVERLRAQRMPETPAEVPVLA